MKEKPQWRRLSPRDYGEAEAFLRLREKTCVPACARFLMIRRGTAVLRTDAAAPPGRGYRNAGSFSSGRIWAFPDGEGGISALLIHSKSCLYPVYSGREEPPLPDFLKKPLQPPLHAVQGSRRDAASLGAALEARGFRPRHMADYDLMFLDSPPREEALSAGPPGLVVREARAGDEGELAEIQGAYEREEVLPRGEPFDPVSSRAHLDYLLAEEEFRVALLGGRIVGKINTNARSFTMRQIGGVYVRPAYRGRGIALRMSALFASQILPAGGGLSLYVKKQNLPARRVYRRLGFTPTGDYRIGYY